MKKRTQRTPAPETNTDIHFPADLDHRDKPSDSVVLQIEPPVYPIKPFNPVTVEMKNPTASSGEMIKLKVNDQLQISSLQSAFNSYFPFLKIEFFKTPHKIGEGSAKNLIYEENRFIRDCRLRHTNGIFEFTENITVSEFEERFLHEHGLSVQVFRKSGNVWLETSATDGWTLKQQNQEGFELSSHFKAS